MEESIGEQVVSGIARSIMETLLKKQHHTLKSMRL